jgi:putative ABC transport system ATP-binding protein
MSDLRAKDGDLIRIARLTKVFQNGPERISVLRDVNLRVNRGKMVAIMGPSGSGKSTLLFILGLFLSPTEGTYLFSGEDVLRLDRSSQAAFRRSRVGFVFQTADLIENSTVYENLEYPLMYANVRRRERRGLIMEALARVKLDHRVRHPSNRLSGGERQRAAIARALVNRPELVLADEPTGQLDQDNSQAVMDHLGDIVTDGSTTVIVVTHDPAIAARCSRVHHLEAGVLHDG